MRLAAVAGFLAVFAAPGGWPQDLPGDRQAPAPLDGPDVPDIRAVVALAELEAGTRHAEHPRIVKALEELESFLADETSRVPDGRETFVLSFGLMAIVEANATGRYDRLIDITKRRLKAAQWGPRRSSGESAASLGGIGYKPSAPPDLYHTSLAIEALRRAGVPAKDAYVQRAAGFVVRCQDFSEAPDRLAPAKDSDHGGFSISPPAGRLSNGDQSTTEWLRPCGSLTCAGLKTLIYCGYPKEDRRIAAALDWLRRNYALTANPGMPEPRSRLYDYWYSWATAMAVLEARTFVDADQVRHNWPRELLDVLVAEQQPDGCWLNPLESESIHEAHPAVTTSLAILTLNRIFALGQGRPTGLRLVTAPRDSDLAGDRHGQAEAWSLVAKSDSLRAVGGMEVPLAASMLSLEE